jgi:hypothetical protein
LAVACVTLGALARITADPGLTPVTGMRTVVAPAAKDTVGGTVAAVLLDSTFAVKPPVGAGPDNVRVRFWVEPLGRLMAGGVNVKAPTTVTARLADRNPGAEAPMIAVPGPAPKRVGCTAGVVDPAGMVTLVEERVTLL